MLLAREAPLCVGTVIHFSDLLELELELFPELFQLAVLHEFLLRAFDGLLDLAEAPLLGLHQPAFDSLDVRLPQHFLVVDAEELCLDFLLALRLHVEFLVLFVQQPRELLSFHLDSITTLCLPFSMY